MMEIADIRCLKSEDETAGRAERGVLRASPWLVQGGFPSMGNLFRRSVHPYSAVYGPYLDRLVVWIDSLPKG